MRLQDRLMKSKFRKTRDSYYYDGTTYLRNFFTYYRFTGHFVTELQVSCRPNFHGFLCRTGFWGLTSFLVHTSKWLCQVANPLKKMRTSASRLRKPFWGGLLMGLGHQGHSQEFQSTIKSVLL